ncbi:MAG: hypothetical protein ABFD80_05555 [Acidobacteriota bacterium]
MSRCQRRVLYLFGGLFAAVLFVPYRSTRVSLSRDVQTNIVWQRAVESGGYMFLFRYLEHSGERLADTADREVRMSLRRAQDVNSIRYDLNRKRLVFELAAIVFLMIYDFLFFCRRRRKGYGEKLDDLQGGPD